MRLISRIRFATAFVGPGGPRVALLKVYRSLRRGGLSDLLHIIGNIWRTSGHHGMRTLAELPGRDYDSWVRRFDTVTIGKRREMEIAVAGFASKPLISVLMPTYNTRTDWLIEAIESVRLQTYPHWELCIADDASNDPNLVTVLRTYAESDSRIRFVVRPQNGHISATSNSALELARGEWIALLDHDDVLPEHALFWVAKAINDNPRAQMIYSDEDKISEDGQRRFGPYFKPDWNHDLFLSQNMFSHLGVFRTELVRSVGGFRIGFEGSQDYDLTLRCMERVRPEDIVHIARVLYHWRVHEQSTSHSHAAKPYVMAAGQLAIGQHLRRRGVRAKVNKTRAGLRVIYQPEGVARRVGVLVTGRGGRQSHLAFARDLLAATTFPDMRVYILGEPEATQDERIVFVPSGTNATWSRTSVHRLADDGCELVCLCDAALRPRHPEWLSELASQATRPEVGVVGPKILSARDTVASAGILLMPGNPPAAVDAHKDLAGDDYGYGGRAQLVQQLSAVRSVCMMLRRDVLLALDAQFAEAGHDTGVPLCEQVRAQGLRVVWTPFAQVTAISGLLPLSPQFASTDFTEDPAYNPNLESRYPDYSLAWPPRVSRNVWSAKPAPVMQQNTCEVS